MHVEELAAGRKASPMTSMYPWLAGGITRSLKTWRSPFSSGPDTHRSRSQFRHFRLSPHATTLSPVELR